MDTIILVTGSLLAVISLSFSLPITRETAAPPRSDIPSQRTGRAALSREHVQHIVCATERLKESLSELPYVELQPCHSAGYSCGPKSSADVATQADIVNGYAQYTAEAEILENFVSPDELLNVLYTINETLPSLLTHDMNLTSPPNFVLTVPVCENDATFQSNCSVHLLNSSLYHLLHLGLHTLPPCTFCNSLDEFEQSQMSSLYTFFSGDYLDQLLPPQCRFLFHFAQYQLPWECMNDVYTLHGRLSDLTQWMNGTLVQMNQSRPELETLVETLGSTVLPSTERAINGLQRTDRCSGSERCIATSLNFYQVSAAAHQFALSQCFPELDRLHSAVIVQLFDLTRQTFNSLFTHLLLEEIITL